MKKGTFNLWMAVIWGLTVVVWAAYLVKNAGSGIVDWIPIVVGILACVNFVLYLRLYFQTRKKEK